MVLLDESAKGLRTILAERGLKHERMKAGDMRTVLSNHDDFKIEKTTVQRYMLRADDTRHFFCQNFTVK